MYGPAMPSRARSGADLGRSGRRERLGVGAVRHDGDETGVDVVMGEQIGLRRLARHNHLGGAVERPGERAAPACVVMRRGLGHGLEGEVVHDEDDAPRAHRRRQEVRCEKHVERSRDPFSSGQPEP